MAEGADMPAVGRRAAAGRAGEAALRGWKAISAYLGVDERTAKRWEIARALPVHRLPGEPRAPVFAFPEELETWRRPHVRPPGRPGPAPLPTQAVAPVLPARRRGLWLLLALLLAAAALLGWREAEVRRAEAAARAADVRRLARAQVAALNDRLEHQPGTVRLREGLVRDAALVLARIAALPDADEPLRVEAAEAWRRLAEVQNSTNRPSLRDRPAARASLDAGLKLLAQPQGPEAKAERARLLIAAAGHAAAGGALAEAPPMLAEATRLLGEARGALPAPAREALARALWLTSSEVAQWQGRYSEAIAAAERVIADRGAALGELARAHDLAAEARYYAGDRAGALAGYGEALAIIENARLAEAMATAPGAPSLYEWALLRQRWNIGSTLLALGRPGEAVAELRRARDGWSALAAADPEDEALAWWVRTTRTSLGEALAAAGNMPAAVAELGASLAERRAALAAQPDNAERQRAMVVGLAALADVLAAAGRRAEACGHYREAMAQVAAMARSRRLTPLDRSDLVPPVAAAQARFCTGA